MDGVIMKNIPAVNYVKVIILCLATIFIVMILANNYKEKIQYERANQDVMGFLSILKYEELSNYLVENHDGFIYMASSADLSLEEFEESLKNYILEEDLEKYFVYLDSSDFSYDMYQNIQNSFFTSDLSKQNSLNNQPYILSMQDGKIVSVFCITLSSTTLNDIKNFVNINGVIR